MTILPLSPSKSIRYPCSSSDKNTNNNPNRTNRNLISNESRSYLTAASQRERDLIENVINDALLPEAEEDEMSQEEVQQNEIERDEEEEDELISRSSMERREFHFNIENDRRLIENDVSSNIDNISNTNNPESVNNDIDVLDFDESLTSEYILSKLYNYMKISEMDKYGISVFEITFSSYLKYLRETDFFKLATSYWCNGKHFKCMIQHRNELININNNNNNDISLFEFDDESSSNNYSNKLQLKITSSLLDSAMQSGASVDKIEAMLKQKRIDDGVNKNKNNKYIKKLMKFYCTKYETNFYIRNLKHRFWNHEVLVRVFIRNGWLNQSLAQVGLNKFILCIYERTLESKLFNINNNNNNNYTNNRKTNIKFNENFLHSFFISFYSLDSIPKMYKKIYSKQQQKLNESKENRNNNITFDYKITEETLRRWCELIELLSSRGAKLNNNKYKFNNILPLKYAYKLGSNTYWLISSNNYKKNKLLKQSLNMIMPDDMWNTVTSYL